MNTSLIVLNTRPGNVIMGAYGGNLSHSVAATKVLLAAVTGGGVIVGLTNQYAPAANQSVSLSGGFKYIVPSTAFSQFVLYSGAGTAGTLTSNGQSGAGLFGGTLNAYIWAQEIMA